MTNYITMLYLECNKARGTGEITALKKLRTFLLPSQPLNESLINLS